MPSWIRLCCNDSGARAGWFRAQPSGFHPGNWWWKAGGEGAEQTLAEPTPINTQKIRLPRGTLQREISVGWPKPQTPMVPTFTTNLPHPNLVIEMVKTGQVAYQETRWTTTSMLGGNSCQHSGFGCGIMVVGK